MSITIELPVEIVLGVLVAVILIAQAAFNWKPQKPKNRRS